MVVMFGVLRRSAVVRGVVTRRIIDWGRQFGAARHGVAQLVGIEVDWVVEAHEARVHRLERYRCR